MTGSMGSVVAPPAVDGEYCSHNTPGAAGAVANDTGMPVVSFPGPNCEGMPMDPASGSFESVVFRP